MVDTPRTPQLSSHIPHAAFQPLEQCPALLLNADYQPISYYPLSLLSWQDALKAVFRESVTVVSEYEREVHSPSMSMKLPSVLALKEYIAPAQKPAFTRFNVYLRDEWRCQYCAQIFRTHELTFDHVIPRSKGGNTSWENIVASCRSCNTRKSDHMPSKCGMHPIRVPYEPDLYDLRAKGRKFPPNFLHESWSDFLYWDSELLDI
jgi:5-methylcytosine-specific restriction endonuclease McrA